MKELYLAIVARLQELSDIKHITLFNDQPNREDAGETFITPNPAVYIEFVELLPKQMGNGVQIYDPLTVRLHISFEKYNDEGYQDRNLEQFDLAQKIYGKMQGFKVDKSGTFVRTAEQPDYDHTNSTLIVQDYMTSWVDYQESAPVDYVEKDPPTNLNLEVTVE